VPTLVLLRHGRTTANVSGTLAGWTPGVHLDERGREQAAAVASRLAALPIAHIATSPLERCQETADAVAAVAGPPAKGARARSIGEPRPEPVVDDRWGECRYGDWTGQPLSTLAKDPLWKVVQSHASAVTFPGGESLRAVQLRAVDAARETNAEVATAHGPDAVWVAVSHGDVIKALLADALGMHLDEFQRIVVDPASVSVIRYTDLRPFVLRVNDTGGELGSLAPPPKRRRRGSATTSSTAHGHAAAGSSDAVVGGGAGAS
jgi:probable phosphomutase (TIGR03848 family)